jgi:hypothetical protein
MKSDSVLRAALVGMLCTACTTAPQTPIPLAGATADVASLAGRWEGSYSSVETGRSGSISFTLTANGDTALGDVIMIPRGFGRPLQAWNHGAAPAGATPPRTAVLTISFVRVAQDRITGTLAPYVDPATGERLNTTFEGQRKGDVIEGRFTTRSAGGSATQTGQWKVTRRQGE